MTNSVIDFQSNASSEDDYYNAFVNRDTHYDGLVYIGVVTTGIVCRPSCPAKKAARKNCVFFPNLQQAMLAGFRPCKRCQPEMLGVAKHDDIHTLLDAVASEPERKWREADIRALGLEPATIRRQFQKKLGMSFVAYARAYRLGLAFHAIREGERVVAAQYVAGYQSGEGFRQGVARLPNLYGVRPLDLKAGTAKQQIVYAHWIETRLGAMLALADDEALYLLEFVDRRGLEKELQVLRDKYRLVVVPGKTDIHKQIEAELSDYFAGKSFVFKTPVRFLGSEFQKSVWKALCAIHAGETRSYGAVAKQLDKEKAVRAVSRAVGQNMLALIVPCHRVIGADGALTGYAGGLARKAWLLELERGGLG